MMKRSTAHPGRLLKRELAARSLSANRLSLDIGVPSGRITDILNGRRAISADTAVRLGRYFGNGAQFWLDLQSQYDIAVVERDHGSEITKRVRPAAAQLCVSLAVDADKFAEWYSDSTFEETTMPLPGGCGRCMAKVHAARTGCWICVCRMRGSGRGGWCEDHKPPNAVVSPD
jgi:addiction module HigA family antidote